MPRLTLFATLVALAVLATSLPAAARAPMTLGVSVPPGRDAVKLDAFIAQMETNGGRKPALWSIWSQWGARNGTECVMGSGEACAFPRAMLDTLHARDITGVVWWEPVIPGKAFPAGVRYGRHKNTFKFRKNDRYIRQWADEARKFGEATCEAGECRKVILRLAHEANGNFFPWVIGQWDNTNKTFKRFWRYVWDIFDRRGATEHVDFFWSMNKKRCPGCNPFKVIWPGPKYVDYVGFTAFNWGAYKRWKSMIRVLRQPMNQLGKVTRKKVIVGELASHFKPLGKSKAKWITNGYKAAYDRWGRLAGIMYLNAHVREFKHPDWRLIKPRDGADLDDGSALKAYAAITALQRFQGQLP